MKRFLFIPLLAMLALAAMTTPALAARHAQITPTTCSIVDNGAMITVTASGLPTDQDIWFYFDGVNLGPTSSGTLSVTVPDPGESTMYQFGSHPLGNGDRWTIFSECVISYYP